jgi:hypothetical protein
MPRMLPPMPSMSSDSVTRSLCHAVHLDEDLRDYVLHTVVNPHLQAVCPSFGVNLVAVARHAVAAQQRTQTRRNAFIACRVTAILAIGLGILTRSPLVAIGLLIATIAVAYSVLAWSLRADRRRAREAIVSSSPPEDQASPLDADIEDRLQDVEKANVIVYANGEGDPFIGSGKRLDFAQVHPVNITRPATDANGNKAVIRSFDAITLHANLAKEMLAMGLHDLQVKNRLYVRGDYAQAINGLLPDKYGSPRSRVKPDQVRSGAVQPTARARTYVCVERVREGGQLVIGMYVRAELEQDLLSIERSLYFLPPIQDWYKPTRDLVANDFTSMTWIPLTTAVSRVLPMLMGKPLSGKDGKELKNVVSQLEEAEATARREIQKGYQYDYGARTSLREAVAAYFTREHFDQADILREAQALDRRLLGLIRGFLDDRGVDTSDFSKNIQQVTMAVTTIGTVQAGTAVVGGQGHLVTGHGAVNNFGSRQAGGQAAGQSGTGFAGTP